jgi:multidrug efflux pump subunit AcrB
LQDSVDLSINISGEIQALDRLRDVVLRENADGTTVRLNDVATITRGIKTPANELAIANGKPAILIGVLAEEGVQIDRWMRFIYEELEKSALTVPYGMSQTLLFDQSTYTTERLSGVAINMAIGVFLVVGVLLFTLGWRSAIIVALVLPVVSLATLATMNFIGLPLHQMSVTGLIVALGLLVDAAIVTCDDVQRRLDNGSTRMEAAGDAVSRLTAPLLASTVTTALAFTPMVLLPGPSGDFVGAIAIAVILMLIWSFFIAVTVTPSIAAWTLPQSERRKNATKSTGWFERLMALCLRNPLRTIALSLILPIMGFASMSTLTAQFFPGVDRNQFYIEVELPPGDGISETLAIAEAMDTRLNADEGVASVYWSIGQSGPAFYYNITGGRSQEPGYAQAMVTTHSEEDASRLVADLQAQFGADFPSAQTIVRSLVQGPPVAAPVELRIEGQNVEVLRRLGDEIREIAIGLDVITAVRTGVNGGAPQIRYQIDEVEARLLGMNITDIAAQLNNALVGVTGGSLVEGTEELPVRVRLDSSVRGDLAIISDLPILLPNAGAISAQGDYPAVPLSNLAEPILEPAESVIIRRDGVRENTIQAFLVPGVLPEEALQDLLAELDARGFTLPIGYELKLGGDSDARSNTLDNLKASIGLIVVLSIATIALTFNSFRLTAIALVVCGLSAGLSILSLAIMQYPFGIVAIFGIIGSIGVSINAAIIILTALKDDEGSAAGDTLAMAGVINRSSRHIVSTTVTTFGGFLPLILDGGGFWPPFAVSIAGGVLLSTIVSFFFVPPMYALVRRRAPKAEVGKASTKVSGRTGLRMTAAVSSRVALFGKILAPSRRLSR